MNTSMKMSKHTGHYLAVLGIVVFGCYAFLLMPGQSNALTTMTVGELSLEVVPVGNEPDREYVRLGYAGAGFVDVTGWTVALNDAPLFIIPSGVLADGVFVRYCSTRNDLVDCIPAFEGDILPDTAGVVSLVNTNGETVVSATYANPLVSAQSRESVGVMQPVHAPRDSVALCHTRDGAIFKGAKDQATKLVSAKGHAADAEDIIPPFYYRFDAAAISYYAGMNWSSGSSTFTTTCQ